MSANAAWPAGSVQGSVLAQVGGAGLVQRGGGAHSGGCRRRSAHGGEGGSKSVLANRQTVRGTFHGFLLGSG